MNILQVNLNDTVGGAARIGWCLFEQYRCHGHQSYMAVGHKTSCDPHVFELPNDSLRNLWTRFWKKLEKQIPEEKPSLLRLVQKTGHLAEPHRWLEHQRGIEDFHHPGTRCLLRLAPHSPDILHFHVLHGDYFDLRTLPRWTSLIPSIVTLHDEWMMTGHCACTFGCERWIAGCGHCPNLTTYPAVRRDATHRNWERKRNIYEKSRLYVATPSRWLMDKVHRSILTKSMVESRVIPNGVDDSVFYSQGKEEARNSLSLPLNAWIGLFVAQGTRTNEYKDYNAIENGFRKFAAMAPPDQPCLLLCVGEEGEERKVDNVTFRFVGYQKEMKTVALYYNAADVYIHGTRTDNFPNTVLESMACGTPVIATAVGGIPEQVNEGQTGFLVPPGDAHAIAECLRELHESPELREKMGFRAIERVRNHFRFEKIARNYLDWYRDILEIS